MHETLNLCRCVLQVYIHIHINTYYTHIRTHMYEGQFINQLLAGTALEYKHVKYQAFENVNLKL